MHQQFAEAGFVQAIEPDGADRAAVLGAEPRSKSRATAKSTTWAAIQKTATATDAASRSQPAPCSTRRPSTGNGTATGSGRSRFATVDTIGNAAAILNDW